MNDHHDTHFGAMIPAVDRRSLKAFGLGVISKGEKHYKDDHMMSERWAEKQDIRNNNLVSRDRDADGYPMAIPRALNGAAHGRHRSRILTMQASIPTTPTERAVIQRIAILQARVLRAAVGRKTISRRTSLQGVTIQRPNLPRATIHIATIRRPAILRAAIRPVKIGRAVI